MKIITYSDLHLEFGTDFKPSVASNADLMILSGDIITFRNYLHLSNFLEKWLKPVLYVAGNHEYYGVPSSIAEENKKFELWLADNHPNVIFLNNTEASIGGVCFFGGTMWTNFRNANASSIAIAQHQINDYRHIIAYPGKTLQPKDTIDFHEEFIKKLINWLEKDCQGQRVVITHHAPVVNPNTKYGSSPLTPAFNSLDMIPIIEKYQPNLWIYGHTHECDDQMIGNTRIISNQPQLGYPRHYGTFECKDFDDDGKVVTL